MRNLRIIVVTLFIVISIVFSVLFSYDRMVLDHEAPTIICDGRPLEVSVSATDIELCAGLSAYDNVDGDITDRIVVRKISQLLDANSAIIYYAVFDSSSNYCTFQRNVTYTDYQKPRFSLSQPLIYNHSAQVILQDRLYASDVLDGDISNRVCLISSNLSSNAIGEYPITLQVTNSTGDTAIVTLTVSIQNYTSQHPIIYLDEYLLYIDSRTVLDVESLRDHIVSVRSSAYGDTVDPSEVKISGEINYKKKGSNNITFSYTNEAGYDYSVILTVVRE